jgi:uncharacterized protein YhbP (UPF0306 family)
LNYRLREVYVNKLLFIDSGSVGEARARLERAAVITGPSWLVSAAMLTDADLEGAAFLVLGGDLAGESLSVLLTAIAPLAVKLAGHPYSLYTTRAVPESAIDEARRSLAVLLGTDAGLVVDLSADSDAGALALRAFRDSRAIAPLPPGETRTRIDAFLRSHKTCALATVSADAIPRATPIEYLWKDDSFFFFSEGGLKFCGLSEGAAVSLCVYDEFSSMSLVRGLQVRGHVRRLAAGTGECAAAFAARGVDPAVLAKHRLTLNVFRVEPELFEFLDATLRSGNVDTRQVLAIQP